MADWHFYIVRTVDSFLYAGISTDVPRRFKEHLAQSRKTAQYLLAHKPQELAFSQAIGDRALALKVEYHFKRLPRELKERIVHSGELHFDGDSGRILIPGPIDRSSARDRVDGLLRSRKGIDMIITTGSGRSFDTDKDLTAPERHILQKLFIWESMASNVDQFRQKRREALVRGWNDSGPITESEALRTIVDDLEEKVVLRLGEIPKS